MFCTLLKLSVSAALFLKNMLHMSDTPSKHLFLHPERQIKIWALLVLKKNLDEVTFLLGEIIVKALKNSANFQMVTNHIQV